MNKTVLINYYGANLFPNIPSSLNEWKDHHGIYRKNKGNGDVYFNQIILNYSNENFSRTINLEIAKTLYLLQILHF